MNKRPTGLTIFAGINFIFSALVLFSLFTTLTSPELQQKTGLSVSAYTIFSPLLTGLLLIVSGVGFLLQNYRAGYLGGIIFCVLSLGNILVFNALQGFEGFALHIPSMVYPALLLLMLMFKYRQAFQYKKEIT